MNNDKDNQGEYFSEAERFLKFEMTPEEKSGFEKKMLQDDRLRQEVDEFRILLLGIQESVLRKKMNGYHEEATAATMINASFKKWLIAASVMACFLVAGWLYMQNSHKSERLFAAYFSPDPGLISGMGSSENYTFDRAMIDYKTGHYHEAIKTWKTQLEGNLLNDTLNYFIGSAYLALKESDTAMVYLRKTVLDLDSEFSTEASWYLGLALIREDKILEAIPYIQRSSHKEKETLLLKLQQ
ncbi:MAG: hypothetical protein ABI687_13915 [Flavitalea sp.]